MLFGLINHSRNVEFSTQEGNGQIHCPLRLQRARNYLKRKDRIGGERGIRSLGHPLDSVSYTNHIARNASNASVAVGPCPFLPPEGAEGLPMDFPLLAPVANCRHTPRTNGPSSRSRSNTATAHSLSHSVAVDWLLRLGLAERARTERHVQRVAVEADPRARALTFLRRAVVALR